VTGNWRPRRKQRAASTSTPLAHTIGVAYILLCGAAHTPPAPSANCVSILASEQASGQTSSSQLIARAQAIRKACRFIQRHGDFCCPAKVAVNDNQTLNRLVSLMRSAMSP